MKELAVFLQNVLQGGPGVNIEVREGRGRCLVANKQIEVGDVPVNNVTKKIKLLLLLLGW